MIKNISIFLLATISTLSLFCQDILLQEYKNDAFEFQYPKKWTIDSSDNPRVSFYYNATLGDITISIYKNKAPSDKELKKIVLEINNKKELHPDIKTLTIDGQTNCTYNYASDKIKYFIKAIKKGNNLYLVSLNWQEKSWDTFKDLLLKSFDSFRPK